MSRTEQFKTLAALTMIASVIVALAVSFWIRRNSMDRTDKDNCWYHVMVYQRISWDEGDSTTTRVSEMYDHTFLSFDAAVQRADDIEADAIANPTPMIDSTWTRIQTDCR